MTTNAIVLAAGKGTRMNSDLAKVLHPLAGQSLLGHVLTQVRHFAADRTVVVVGHQADRVKAVCDEYGAETALQAEQLGTGHAVQQAEPMLGDQSGVTVVLSGDVPLLQAATLRRLVETTAAAQAAAGVLTAIAEDPTGYGRILRGPNEPDLVGIVEHKDATEEQRAIREYNTGTYCFQNEHLWPALRQVGSDNAQGEFYVTDVVEILVRAGHRVVGVVCEDEREVQGVNRPEDLMRVEADLQDIGSNG